MNDKALHVIQRKKNEKCVFMKENLYLYMTIWKNKSKKTWERNTNEAHTNEENAVKGG